MEAFPSLHSGDGLGMAYSRRMIKANYGKFVQQYARKRSKNVYDPNDRAYDRRLEQIIRRMKPEELAAIVEDDYDNSADA